MPNYSVVTGHVSPGRRQVSVEGGSSISVSLPLFSTLVKRQKLRGVSG